MTLKKSDKKQFLEQAAKHESKNSLFARLERFMKACVIAFCISVPLYIHSYLVNHKNINLIESIDSKRQIARAFNTYNFLADKDEYGFYAMFYVTKDQVKSDLVDVINLKRNNRFWTAEMIDNTAELLTYFNNDDKFMIDYRIMLAIFAHESDLNPYIVSAPNFNGTRDYGIGQHNSCCIDDRFAQASMFNRKLGIIDNKLMSRDRLNVYAGVISTAQHLAYNREVLLAYNKTRAVGKLGPDHWIIGYNSGMGGLFSGGYTTKYLNKIEVNFERITEL